MVSAEVHRTLVKSPPELWAELSDPTALARHLGELGDIRIVRTQPETSVEWAAENISGTVSIKPSGWGTKVTLSVTRELESVAAEEPPTATEEPAAEEPFAVEQTAIAETDIEEPTPALEAYASDPLGDEQPVDQAASAEAAPTAPVAEQPEPRRGFFARLFGRRRKDARALDDAPKAPDDSPEAPRDSTGQVDAFAAVRQALVPETVASTHAFDSPPAAEPAPDTVDETESAPDDSAPPADISAELLAVEQVAVEQVTAVLTAALDRLGAAHHRPFSRA